MIDNNLRVERAVKRISQAQLAEVIGVSRQTIFAIENNKFIPSTELALKLSAYFGKTVNELFWLKE
ncbi:MAG: helix-turn-helix transcriptional regulator [Bacteroidaceae bacterium]|nr:helix-turn-helix transcriptional regulator [Bacteroidaceae bacterium]MDE6159475.1 helix-turn-helix transcriptional regulator [Bacteroidaceae bacterium]